MASRQALLSYWKSPDGDLPFATELNESVVLQHLRAVCEEEGVIKNELRAQVDQWIRFNSWCNAHGDCEYNAWVAQIYTHINTVCHRTVP